MFELAGVGAFHKLPPKHPHRRRTEFQGGRADRHSDAVAQMANLARRRVGRRLKPLEPTAPPGESNYARTQTPRT